MRDLDRVREVVEAGLAQLGRLNITVANAGIFTISPLAGFTGPANVAAYTTMKHGRVGLLFRPDLESPNLEVPSRPSPG